MLSTLERIRVEKELHAKQEILAESYIELSEEQLCRLNRIIDAIDIEI